MDRTYDRTPDRVPDRAALLLGAAAARPSPSEDRPPRDRRDAPAPGRPAPRVTTDSVEAYYRGAPLRHAPSFY